MSKKILVVVTSVAKYPEMDRATGLWLGEAVHFVKKVQENGYEVDFVSPQGGYTPIDPSSLKDAPSVDWEWYENKAFMNRLGSTLKPSDINSDDYVAIYYAGGHGVVWDLLENAELQEISQKIYENNGYVTSVCHGAVALVNIKLADGSSLIKGKKVTGFSNEEEDLAGLTEHMPYLTENALKEQGANYQKADEAWASFAVVDGRVISGQNPASSAEVAEKLIKSLA